MAAGITLQVMVDITAAVVVADHIKAGITETLRRIIIMGGISGSRMLADNTEFILSIKPNRTMSDDKTKRRPLDASRINIHEEYEVNWWCHELGITKAQLVAAVNAVGTSAAAVKKHLGK